MFAKIFLLAALITIVVAYDASSYASVHQHQIPVATYHHAHHEEKYPHAHPKYEYKYGVEDQHTHDIKSQNEERDGDVVKGFYTVVQPDGRTRTVHYTADKHNGFHADVSYSGHAAHQYHH